MPRGDGTGPAGAGPMTGRAGGYCAGFAVPGYINPAPGRGMAYGGGRGLGLGFRGGRGGRWAPAYPTAPTYAQPAPYVPPAQNAQEELDMLKAQARNVGTALENINKRISELETADRDA